MNTPFQGGCHCGSVRYECSAEPYTAFYCHCLDCQKNTGAPFSVEVIVPKNSVTLYGDLQEYETKSASNDSVLRKFCGNCGTPLLSEPRSYPDILSLKVSSLDDPRWVQPKAHVWTINKQPWLQLNDDLPKYDRNM